MVNNVSVELHPFQLLWRRTQLAEMKLRQLFTNRYGAVTHKTKIFIDEHIEHLSKSRFLRRRSLVNYLGFQSARHSFEGNKAEIRSITSWLYDRTSHFGCVPKPSWAQACRISSRVYQAFKSIQCSHEIYPAFFKILLLPSLCNYLGLKH